MVQRPSPLVLLAVVAVGRRELLVGRHAQQFRRLLDDCEGARPRFFHPFFFSAAFTSPMTVATNSFTSAQLSQFPYTPPWASCAYFSSKPVFNILERRIPQTQAATAMSFCRRHLHAWAAFACYKRAARQHETATVARAEAHAAAQGARQALVVWGARSRLLPGLARRASAGAASRADAARARRLSARAMGAWRARAVARSGVGEAMAMAAAAAAFLAHTRHLERWAGAARCRRAARRKTARADAFARDQCATRSWKLVPVALRAWETDARARWARREMMVVARRRACRNLALHVLRSWAGLCRCPGGFVRCCSDS